MICIHIRSIHIEIGSTICSLSNITKLLYMALISECGFNYSQLLCRFLEACDIKNPWVVLSEMTPLGGWASAWDEILGPARGAQEWAAAPVSFQKAARPIYSALLPSRPILASTEVFLSLHLWRPQSASMLTSWATPACTCLHLSVSSPNPHHTTQLSTYWRANHFIWVSFAPLWICKLWKSGAVYFGGQTA